VSVGGVAAHPNGALPLYSLGVQPQVGLVVRINANLAALLLPPISRTDTLRFFFALEFPMPASSTPPPAPPASGPGFNRRRWELGVFLIVLAVIIPFITVATIATYALFVWIFQMLVFGPPGPLGG
jgi:periplasmic nitrate reductase NapE